MLTSYAQNFEDVMLWRALSHVEHGFYIDIGAQDPLIDSVSLAFHEHGWRGIHIEPSPHYAELLRQQRPGDTVIQAAVGKGPDVIRFFEIPGTGISTADAVIAQQHRERGFDVHETTVPCVALSAIFKACEEPEIHWLKIDVEGFEKQVLTSWGKSQARPWIVVVESTLPLTQIESHESWESILIGYGYTPAYFDGLNRYYISDVHPELKNAFLAPPNVFDGFALSGTASTSFHQLIDARYKEKISEILAQNEQQEISATNEIERLTLSLASLDKLHAEREQSMHSELATLRETLARAQVNAAEREKALSGLAQQTLEKSQSEAQAQLTGFIERERAIAEQLAQVQREAQQSAAEQSRVHSEREQALAEQLQAGQQELSRLHQGRAQREQELAAQLLSIQQQGIQEKAEQAKSHNEQEHALQRQHAEREHALVQQLQAVQQELSRLQQDRSQSEKDHAEQTNQIRQELQNLLRTQVQREQEVAAQLLSVQYQHNEQLRAEHVASQKLQQAFSSLQGELATMHNSFSWRLTAPLRIIAGRFSASRSQAEQADSAAEQPVVAPISHPESDTAAHITQEFTTNSTPTEITSMISERSAQVTQPPTSNATLNLKSLLQYQDRQFVECAYLALLKRQPDHEGFNYYIGLIRAGVPKVQILGQMMESREARKLCVEIPGLREAIRRQKLTSLPLVGRVLQVFMGSDALGTVSPLNELPMRHHNMFSETERENQTRQNRGTEINQATQEGIDVKVMTTAEIEGGLRLFADRSIDEPAWLRYLEQVIYSRLISPLRAAGTPPPASALVVIIDCAEGSGTIEERSRTRDSLTALLAASEYPVKPYWYVHNDEVRNTIEKEIGAATLTQVVNRRKIGEYIDDEDIVLVLKPGDEVRPEIHMALKYFGAFNAEFTLIDMFFRDNVRIFPILLHAVDPIHSSHCNYFFGRYAANGKCIKKFLDRSSNANPSLIGAAICSQLKVEDCRSYRHIAIPLLCIQTSNSELATLRETIILERAPFTQTSILTSSSHDLKTVGKSPSTIRQAPVVSAIICTKDCGLLLRQLLNRLEREPLIRDIVIVSNNTTNVHAISTLVTASTLEQVTVLGYDGSFNFSRQCNIGAKHAKGDVLLFLNDDMAPVSDDWLQRLLDWMDSPRIVGPLLIYPNESVQHAGMHLGFNGVAGHVMRHSRLPTGDYGFFLTSPRRVSCLTGAALMMPKSLFSSLNGFDPMLATYLQDVDFSLRALHFGCELVLDPRSIIMHMESVSVIPTLNDTKIRRTRELEYAYFVKRWGDSLKSDAWMNPLFDPMDESLTVLRT